MIEVKKTGCIATVIINNETKRNALNLGAWEEITITMSALNRDDSLRCIIFRGAGEKAFAAGADISEFLTTRKNSEQAILYGEKTAEALKSILECRHPTFAVIQGACTGGGLEIAICCDIRIASINARFGIPINRLGHAFAPAEMKPLLDVVGRGVTLELLIEGRIFSAKEALNKGLISRIIADRDFDREVDEIALRIANGAPQSARITKWVANLLAAGEAITKTHIEQIYAPCDTDDYQEGVHAFLKKKQPRFLGK